MAPSTDQPRLLVAEDHPDIRLLLESQLRQAGYEVIAVTDGEGAIRLARSEQPDAVILDVVMPGLDGLSVLDDLRSDPRTRDIPVILVTANAQETQVTEGIRRGADAYVTKPFVLADLLAPLEQLLADP